MPPAEVIQPVGFVPVAPGPVGKVRIGPELVELGPRRVEGVEVAPPAEDGAGHPGPLGLVLGLQTTPGPVHLPDPQPAELEAAQARVLGRAETLAAEGRVFAKPNVEAEARAVIGVVCVVGQAGSPTSQGTQGATDAAAHAGALAPLAPARGRRGGLLGGRWPGGSVIESSICIYRGAWLSEL